MPYVVKKGKGDRPFRIVNQKTGETVGTSKTLKNAWGSIAHRMDAESSTAKKNIRHYKRKVDNKMRSFGSVDFKKRIVKINKSKKKNPKGEVLDTIVHEKTHILHPKMYERTVRKQTAKTIKRMGRRQKQKNYNLFKT